MWKRLLLLARRMKLELSVYRAVAADPRCPRLSRWLLLGAVAYALSPIDLIPDVVPVLGHVDDVVVLPLLIWLAVRMIPGGVIEEHRARLRREATVAADDADGR